MVILPFTLATSVVLLFALLALADHEALEEQVRLAGLREIYYQGVQRENQQIRTLRHDLRNHVMAVSGLLERGETEQALGYLEQLTQSSALSGGGRLCDNEVANVVLTAKATACLLYTSGWHPFGGGTPLPPVPVLPSAAGRGLHGRR